MANGQRLTAAFIDTHCHLADPAFAEDLPAVMERAWAEGLERIVVIGESRPRAEQAFALAATEPRLSIATGVHPHDAREWGPELAAWLGTTVTRREIVAVGEIGLDYHYDHSPRPEQLAAFEAQMALAAEVGKPVVIHAREADEDVAAILRNHPGVTAILHSFSSGAGLLGTAVGLGHYVSFSGMVTFRNWQLDGLVREVPADRLLVETDAPYLAPVPRRGKRNEPALVRFVAERLAQVRDVPFEVMAAETTRNARRVFRLETDPR